jgi:hypothetical protein
LREWSQFKYDQNIHLICLIFMTLHNI